MDSISNFMNSLVFKLINDNKLLPHKNQYGQYMAYGPYRVLERADMNSVVIVKVLNGEAIYSGNVKEEILKTIDIVHNRKISRLKPIIVHFVICATDNYSSYKQIADEFMSTLTANNTTLSITLVNMTANNVYIVNSNNYINNNINNFVYQSFGGKIIYDQDITSILTGVSKYHHSFNIKGKITVTKIIIGINILFWLLGVISERLIGYDIFKAIGIQNPRIIGLGHQYWRFVTPIFLHGDIIHMLSNSYFLFICGELVEKHVGKAKFIFLYLITGIIGNVVSFFIIDPRAFSLGASGACLGVGGALVYMWLTKKSNFLKYYSGVSSLIIMIIINVFYGFTTTGIDNGAHVGGFISGFIIAFILDKVKGLRKAPGR